MHAAIWRGLGLGAILVTFIQTSAVAQAPTPYQMLTKEQPSSPQWKTAVAQVTAPPAGSGKSNSLPTPAPLLPDQQPIPISPSSSDSAKLAQLRADVAALIGTSKDNPVLDESGSSERARLQGQLDELLKRLNSQPPAGGTRPPTIPPPKTKFDPTDTRPIDTLRLAMNLFRDNDFDAALRAFRFIQPAQLPPEDRPFVQFMIASCLRRLNRLSEAAVVYREVAQSPDDEFIASSAVSQLALIRTQQELEAQLEQLRIRMKGR